jgi:lipopolysaccharide export system permease protein
MMAGVRLLDRYVLRELVVPLGYCLGGFLVFWISADLINNLDDFREKQMIAGDIAAYYLVQIPEYLVTVTPLGLLLALLYALTNLARHNELTAMRAAGVSVWRLSIPYFLVGLLLSCGLFAMNEFAVPDAAQAAEAIRNRHTRAQPNQEEPGWQRDLAFRNDRDQRTWNIGAFHLETGEMRGVNVDWPLPDGLRRRLSAKSAAYTNGVWVLYEVNEMVLNLNQAGDIRAYGETNMLALPDLTETPEQIRSEIKFSQLSAIRAAKRPRLTLREILVYQHLHPYLKPLDRAKLQTQFHGRLAEPWTCLGVVFIAVPFGAPSGRRNAFVGVAASIFIGFSYFMILRFGLALGTGGYLPPWVAAWLPNAAFSLVGAVLISRLR